MDVMVMGQNKKKYQLDNRKIGGVTLSPGVHTKAIQR